MTLAGVEAVVAGRPRRIYATVALVAVVVYLGALANRFAMDDLPLIVGNPLVASASGWWRAFAAPYWPPDFGGAMYRPLTISSWALDHVVDGALWYHLINLAWHAGVSVAVAALALRLAEARSALTAGLLFAVHPLHVEAVANITGRAELMAAAFVVLGVYAALVRGSVWWCAVAWSAGLLCKENAAVLPGLVAGAWILGLGRPGRRRMALFVGSWLVIAAVYALVRWDILRPYTSFQSVTSALLGQSWLSVRLTAIAELADVARLLVFPLTLRADYSPDERTVVTSPGDWRFLVGFLCLLAWGALLVLAWRRRRRVEAFGLAWIGVAFLPVANLVFPAGFLLAERTLYLPSAGLALAAGAWLARQPARSWVLAATGLVVLGGVRTALRVPVWRDNVSVTLSILEDSPHSYVGPKYMIGVYLNLHQPQRALEAARRAASIEALDPNIYVTGAAAAFAAGRYAVADSMLATFQRLCRHCYGYYRQEAVTAREHGYAAVADSLAARAASGAAP